MRISIALLFILTSFNSFANSANDSDTLCKIRFETLPQKRIIPVWTATATAHRLSISKITQNNNYIASMGGVFPVVSTSYKNKTLQFSAAGSVYSQLVRPKGHLMVMTVDYFADFFFDLELNNNFSIRTGSGHTSHHFTDDALEIFKYKKSINYVRDYYQFFVQYSNKKLNSTIYGGVYYNYHFLIPHNVSNTFIYEVGGECYPFHIWKKWQFFVAFDIKYREELNFKTSQNYQTGLRYVNEFGKALRVAVNQRIGMEERGQFYNLTNNFTSLSAYFDF